MVSTTKVLQLQVNASILSYQLTAVLVYEFRNRPCSPWSLCGSVVEHRSAESEGLRFDSSKGLRIFSLSHVRNETKNNFLYSFIELKTYHFSYHLSEFEGLKFESSWRRKTSILVMYWYSSPADATDTNIKYLFGIYHSDKGLLKKGKYDLKHPWPGDYVKIVLLNHTMKILTWSCFSLFEALK